MKFRLFTLFIFLILIIGVKAQGTGCPDIDAGPNQTLPCNQACTTLSANVFEVGATNTYTVSSIPHAPPIAYNAAGGTGVSVNTDDVWSSVINLPFPFCFFGQTYNSCIIGSNGAISFNTADAGGYDPWPFSASVPSASLVAAGNIFGPYHDIDPSVAGTVKWYLTGQAPCRTLIVSFNNLGHYDCTSLRSTHMMVLYETTNVIEVYVQQKQTCSGWNSGNTVIGIQNMTGTVGYAPPGRNTGAWTVSTPEAWQFKPSGASIYSPVQWFDGPTLVGTGASINVCPPLSGSKTYTAKTAYTRCDNLQIPVEDNVTINRQVTTIGVPQPNVFTCAGSPVILSAASTTANSYTWNPGGLTGSSVTVSPSTTTTYTVIGTNTSNGCKDTATATVTIAQPTSSACNVLYVTPTGSPSGNGTKASPYDLITALEQGACNGTIVKMAVGDYITDTAISKVTSYITLEGGFDPTLNWDKISTAGATRILRTATQSYSLVGTTIVQQGNGVENESGANPNITAIRINSQSGFRFQDLTIQSNLTKPGTTMSGFNGVSVIGVEMNNCASYNFVRTQVITNAAANGANKDWSIPATNGGSSVGLNLISNGAGGNALDCRIVVGAAGTAGVGPPNGIAGVSNQVRLVSGSALSSSIINFNLPGQPFIRMDDISCTATNIGFLANTSQSWAFGTGSSPATATGTNVITQYSNLGRKNITYNANSYRGFANIILDSQVLPTFTTSAPFVDGHYRVCAGTQVGFQATNGGIGYVYVWDLGGGAAGQNTFNGTTYQTVSGVFNTPGIYTIQLNYETSCCGLSAPTTLELYVEENPNAVMPSDATICLGTPSGVNLNVTGGTTNGTISWSPSAGLNATNLYSVIALPLTTTTYTATLADSTGLCTDIDDVTITVIDLVLSPSSTNVICNQDGTASVSVSGGSGNYSYLWSNGGMSSTITNLYQGTYSVLVTDNVYGCQDSIDVVVNPGATAINGTPYVQPIICYGSGTALAAVSISGGNSPYTYDWSHLAPIGPTASLSDTAYNLSSGSYSILVTDNSGCTYFYEFDIENPNPLYMVLDSLKLPTCHENTDGYVEIRTDGGTRPYTFTWSNGASVVVINDELIGSNLPADSLYLYVEDFNGCRDTMLVDLTVDSLFGVLDTGACQNTSIILPNGSNYTVTIDSSFNVVVQNSNGCDSTITINVTAYPVTNSTVDTSLCYNDYFTIVNGGSIQLFNDTLLIDSLISVNGCDSVINYNVSVDNYVVSIIDTTICQGQSYTLNGTAYTANGTYYDTLHYAASGCDSVQYVLNLNIDSFEVTTIDTTICQGQSYTLNGTIYSANGTYYDTLHYAASGCDSVQYVLNLNIDSFEVTTIDTTICQGQTYTLNGTVYTASGTYYDTLHYAMSGCDSMQYILNLNIDSFEVTTIDTTICQGQTYTLNGTVYTENGTYYDTLHYAVSGCDSVQYVLNLNIDSFEVTTIDTTICQGQTYTLNGMVYSANGTYYDTLHYAASGCDSVQYVLNLNIDSFEITTIDTTICQGQTYTLNGMVYTANGTYYDTLHYVASGCDSVQYVLNLSIDSFEVTTIDTTICQGQTYTLNGTVYTANGTYYDTLHYAASGCDSVQYVLNLNIDSFEVTTIDTTICQGQTYTLNGMVYSANGTYYDTLHYAVSGCDSVQYVINLNIDSFEVTTIDTTICQGQTYTLNGMVYSANGIYYDTLHYAASGCDSVQYVLNLNIDSFEVTTIDTTICQGQTYTLNGTVYTANGTYYDTLHYAVSGCDSVQYVLNLQIDSFEVTTIDTTICQGQTYTLNGTVYTENGTYYDTLHYAVSGCDSVQYVLNLNIDSFEVTTIDTTICQGQTYTLNGTVYTVNGTYYDTLHYAVSGCDSVQYVLNLQIDSFEVTTIDTTICQGQTYTLNGTVYTENGTYYDTLHYAVSGCDSVQYVLNLNIDSFEVTTIDTTICQGQTYTLNGTVYTANGTYYDTLHYAASGCDSVQYVLNLQIDSFEVTTIDTTICQGQTYTLNGMVYSANGIYYDTLHYAASGCDSVQYVLNLNIDSFEVTTIDTTICQGQTYTLNGTVYTANGTYYDTLHYAVSGCDSVQYVLNLQIDSFEVTTIDTTICQGQTYTLNGTVYTASGTYYDTLNYAASGCDSVQYVLNLNIDSFEVTTIDTTICQGQTYTLNGTVYTANGTYYDTLHYAVSGCDSVQYVLNLQIDSFEVTTIDTTICQGQTYTLNGTVYSANGTYYDTLHYVASGCDSVQYVLNLQIDSFEVTTIDTTICQGQTYTLNGTVYSANGTYYDTLHYVASGCDSVQYVLNLQIDSFEVTTIDTTICQGQTYTLNGTVYSANGTYYDTLHYAVSGCDSVQYVINLNIDSFEVTTIDTTICQGQTYTLNGMVYSANGTYYDTLHYAASGCDSVQYVLNLNIDSFEVTTIDTTICQGQTYTLNGTVYSASGTYYDTLNYSVSGCDSMQYVLNLQIDSFTADVFDTTICFGQSYTFNGVSYTTSGTYYDGLTYSVSGCDSFRYVLNLQVDSFENLTIDTTLCQGSSFVLNGTSYNQTGTYYDTLYHSISGCDSIHYVLNLQIDSFEQITINDTICQGETYSFNGVNYAQSGSYFDTLQYSQSGCDSIQFTINLLRLDYTTDTITETICSGSSYTFNGMNYTQEGTYYDTLQYASFACDSMHYVININVDSVELVSLSPEICEGESYTLNGTNYTLTGTYYDTLYHSVSLCDSFWYQINLTVHSLPVVIASASPNDSVCENQTVTLNASGAVSYNWLNGAQSGIPFNPSVGTTQYIVEGTDANGCMNNDTINITGLPTAQTALTITICEDELHTLPDGSQVNTAGVYTNVLPSANGCDSTVTTTLNVNNLGTFEPLGDLVVCSGLSESLLVTASNMVSFEWFVNEGSGNQSLLSNANYIGANTIELSFNLDTALNGNVYTLQMVDECGNLHSTQMTLEVFAPHLVDNPIADTTFCLHEIEVVSVDYNGYNYEWNTGELGSSILPDYSGEYIVNFIENYTNCLMSDTINITLEDCIGNCVVLAPTGFSPDASGANDIFRVVTTCDEGFSYFLFNVYNRWGELIYSTNDWREGWDGTYKGRDAEIGVYTYYVEYTKELTNQKEMLKGNVTLVR